MGSRRWSALPAVLKKSVSTIADACARRNAFHVSHDLNGARPIRFRPNNLRRYTDARPFDQRLRKSKDLTA